MSAELLPIAVDTETELITERAPLPRVVCLSWAAGDTVELVHRPQVPAAMETILDDPDMLYVGHQSDYDLGVALEQSSHLAGPIFRALDEGRVSDTKTREQLHAIADGSFEQRFRTKDGFSLNRLAKDYLGIELDKGEDGWRLRYGELIDVPLHAWPERAVNYAKGDAVSTRRIRERQEERFARGYKPPDEVLQVRSQFALKLLSAYGVTTDPAEVAQFKATCLDKLMGLQGALINEGLVRENGSRNMALIKERIERAYDALGRPVPLTDGGATSTSEETIEEVTHLDPLLSDLADYAHVQKLLGSFVPVVEKCTAFPGFADFNNLLETGRTSCRGVVLEVDGKSIKRGMNWQQMPREPGARECVKAREGMVLVSVDYEIAELRALSQICYVWFGRSAMREAFIAGRDPHLQLGASLLGITYEEAIARKKAGDEEVDGPNGARQFAKIPNFGMAGGMGAAAFVQYARGYGYRLSEYERTMHNGREVPSTRELKEAWLREWPEMRAYFNVISELTSETGPRAITQIGSGRVRGNVRFTEAANGYFQGYVADMAKDALYRVTRACYIYDASYPALYGCRPMLFVHDEIVLEAPEEQAADAAEQCRALMMAVQEMWMPDIPAAAEAKISRRWSKKAKPVRVNGRLIPWEDRTVAA